MRSLLLSFFVLFFLACGNPSSDTPVKVMVLVPNAKNMFEPQQKQLTRISNMSKLEGDVATFIGSARLLIDEEDAKQQSAETLEELKKAVFKDKGSSVHAQFIEKDGVLWPADFHSWAMTTAYWNLEQAFLYFQEAYGGRDTTELLNLPTYYWLDFMESGKKASHKDNAFFHNGFRFMAILPFKELQTIPMSINLGVMAHEYAHFVFNARVHESNPFSPSHVSEGDAPFIMDALNEGLADFHAYGVTRRLDGKGNQNFLEWTLGKAEADKRNFADPTQCWSTLDELTIYTVGTLFAASFYQAASKANKLELMAKFLINAYSNNTPQGAHGIREHYIRSNPRDITFASVANVFLAHITDEDLRRRTCNELMDRFDFPKKALPNCPESSERDSNADCYRP